MRRFSLPRWARYVSLLLAFDLPLGAPAMASAEPAKLDQSEVAKVIDPLMEEWLAHGGAGAVVVVVDRGGAIFSKGYGFADKEAHRPFTPDLTLVRPGSISKLFTGAAVMQLVEAGKLDLDRNVEDYLDFAVPTPPGGVPVTLRLLLSHRAGFEEHGKELFSRGPKPRPLGEWLAKYQPPRLFPKGDTPAYSNYGLALAGYVVERVSGEHFADYAARHILEPLGMRRSTFRQPLPADLAPMMAKGYRAPDEPPLLPFFETTAAAPAGALSATGEDMGRFMRALLNGGELDGVRILSRESLEKMMPRPNDAVAGYVGLAFIGESIAGREAVGHGGGTLAFRSDLHLFREQGIGVFVSRDGYGNLEKSPMASKALAERFLRPPAASDVAAAPADSRIAGLYHSARRAESSLMRVADLLNERLVEVDEKGEASAVPAVLPFIGRQKLKRVEHDQYESAKGGRFGFVGDGERSYFGLPAMRLQRVPWFLDVRWIAPAFLASSAFVLSTLLAWPAGALWRRWRKKPQGADAGDGPRLLAVRLILLADAAAVAITAGLLGVRDFTLFGEALDPLLLLLYALAWIGLLGAPFIVWTAARPGGHADAGPWARLHRIGLAASALMIAWVFVTFRVAGTTLNY